MLEVHELKKCYSGIPVVDRVSFAIRPGEIFGLKWGRLEREYVDVRQRVYRGQVGTPKTVNSVRCAALLDGTIEAIRQWLAISVTTGPEDWVFPSEKGTTPLAKDNCWRRHIQPQLEAAGLGWVNFHVMRKTHSCLLAELDVAPKVRADPMGQTVDVNENAYTQASRRQRLAAANALESRCG